MAESKRALSPTESVVQVVFLWRVRHTLGYQIRISSISIIAILSIFIAFSGKVVIFGWFLLDGLNKMHFPHILIADIIINEPVRLQLLAKEVSIAFLLILDKVSLALLPAIVLRLAIVRTSIIRPIITIAYVAELSTVFAAMFRLSVLEVVYKHIICLFVELIRCFDDSQVAVSIRKIVSIALLAPMFFVNFLCFDHLAVLALLSVLVVMESAKLVVADFI